MTDTCRAPGVPILKRHADDMVSDRQLSGYKLKDISDLSGIPISTLAIECIKIYAEPDSIMPGSAWLLLASLVCEESREGEGQAALKRLAQLLFSVQEGSW